MNLKGKTIVVTGASSNIGRNIISNLARENTQLILVAKNPKELANVARDSEKLGAQVNSFLCDFTDKNDIARVSKQIKDLTKKIDIFVNCAGIGVYKKIDDLDVEEWDNSLAINVTAPFIFIKELLPLLEKSPESVVINTGSGMGVIPEAGRLAYCVSKFALRGLSLSLSKEFKGKSPQFILLTLGSVLTPFGPLSLKDKEKRQKKGDKRYLDPEWLGTKIVSLIKTNNLQEEIVIYPKGYKKER